MNVALRPARVGDVRHIADIVNDYAERGLMLHRSHAELYEHLRDYEVAEVDGAVEGVAGLRIMWADLAEIYALAVTPAARGRGIGRRLVEAMVAEAERLGIRRLFALTYERAFFERCGFQVVDRHVHLPLKVWRECVRCPKCHRCDEIAVVRVLDHIEAEVPAAVEPARESLYEVPVLSEAMRRVDRAARQEPDG